jgi:hypothetical protein
MNLRPFPAFRLLQRSRFAATLPRDKQVKQRHVLELPAAILGKEVAEDRTRPLRKQRRLLWLAALPTPELVMKKSTWSTTQYLQQQPQATTSLKRAWRVRTAVGRGERSAQCLEG